MKEVYWICPICGMSYLHRVKGKHRETDCIKCRNRYIRSQSISTTHPQIMEYWDFEKNNELGLDPTVLKANSSYKAYWKCLNGHESYLCGIDKKCLRNTRCPKCRTDYIKDIDHLKKEFDYKKNNIPIDNITSGSDAPIWWLCEKNHSYKSQPYHRTRDKMGCPYCSNKKVLKGYNSLFDTNPELKVYWAKKENEKIGLDPSKLHKTSKKVAYWVCENKHLTKKSILNMVEHPFCEVCKIESQHIKVATLCKVKNDQVLLEQFSDVFKRKHFRMIEEYQLLFEKYWDFQKNEENPYMWQLSSIRTYYWKCDKGHSWIEKVDSLKTRKVKCKACFNEEREKIIEAKNASRASLVKNNIKYREIIESFWDFEKNGDIDPYNVLVASGPYYFKCNKKESHKWEKDFIGMCNVPKCPFCEGTEFSVGNSIAVKCPGVVKYWNAEKNQGRQPSDVLANDAKNYWWTCEIGHEFIRTLREMEKSIHSEYKGCPYCKKQISRYTPFTLMI